MSFRLNSERLNGYFEQFRKLRVAVIGDLMLDQYIQGAVERISPEGPIPVVQVHQEMALPGGAANVALNLDHLGAECSLVGLCGRDASKRAMVDCFRTAGLDVTGIVTDPDTTTIVKTRVLARHQQLLRVDREELGHERTARRKSNPRATAAVERRLIAVARKALRNADAVVLSDYTKGCLTPKVVGAVIHEARRRKLPILVDSKDSQVDRYRGVDWIKPNRKEAARVVGFELTTEADYQRAAAIFAARTGCKVVAITRSSKGMSIFERQGTGKRARLNRLDSPTHALEVFDVTGGGDTAIAVMALMAACKAPLEDTIELANLASGVTVSHVGTYGPTPREILELFAHHTVSAEAGKVVTREQAAQLMQKYRAAGRKVAFTNGCFDIFHAGHAQTLRFARSQGDLLIVAINSDASVRRQGKGPDRPLVDENARAMVLASLACVDHVIIYGEDTPIPLLKKLRPDVLVKGGDYSKGRVVGWEIVEQYGGRVVVAPLVDGLSTTRLVEKIRNGKQ